MRDGYGSPKGLTIAEQIQWASTQLHPFELQWNDILSDRVKQAVKFECTHDPADIDAMRLSLLELVTSMAEKLAPEQARWRLSLPPCQQKAASKLHVPWLIWLARWSGYDRIDLDLIGDLRAGFPFLGELPPLAEYTKPVKPVWYERISIAQLVADRYERNCNVIESLRASEWSQDIWETSILDAEEGFNSRPRPVFDADYTSRTFCKRLPVREERSKGWRTRVVDEETDSGVNPATVPVDSTHYESADVLIAIVLEFFHYKVPIRMWKRDISKAFRRLLLRAAHLPFASSVFKHDNLVWIIDHFTMIFGANSANQSWHRVGNLISYAVQVMFKAPVARYVDDWFGASHEVLTLSAGRLLDTLMLLCGLPCDPGKSVDAAEEMTVLASFVQVDFRKLAVSTCIDPCKAKRWCDQLKLLIQAQQIHPDVASKFAGRLSCVVTTATDRVGRAFVKPFYAQTNAPLPHMSVQLTNAATWWVQYLAAGHRCSRSVNQLSRPTVMMWSDAAGASRWLAAFCLLPDQRWYWTRLLLPDSIWNQLLDRSDHQIGYQEFLAVILGLHTFDIHACLLWSFIDNQGVLSSLVKGSCNNPEINIGIGHFWMTMCNSHIGFCACRVESKANLADGPTREELIWTKRLNAIFVAPRLPQWAYQLWSWPIDLRSQ